MQRQIEVYLIWVSLFSYVCICMCNFLLDMVELMLMQNAQMHQIIMHNMMLKAMPPMALSPPGGPSHCAPPATSLWQVYKNTHTFWHIETKKSLTRLTKLSCMSRICFSRTVTRETWFLSDQMSNQGEVLSIIIITMVLPLQLHSCPQSATIHGYQACHLSQRDKQGDIYPPCTT